MRLAPGLIAICWSSLNGLSAFAGPVDTNLLACGEAYYYADKVTIISLDANGALDV